MAPLAKPQHPVVRSPYLLAALGVCAALALTACGSDTSPDAKSPAPSASSTAPSPPAGTSPDDAEKTAALSAYDRMWAEQVKAYAQGDAKGTDLATYSAALALSGTQKDLEELRSKGIVTTGAPTHRATVTNLDTTAKIPKASLSDCLDTSAWKFIYRTTSKPVAMPTNQLVRYVTEAKAEKWGQQWKIVDVVPQQRAC
ncbi:hypothetical protein [Streptomyces sp. NPDC001205]